MAELYGAVVSAGLHSFINQDRRSCQSYENVQRDVNIALINELAMIFDREYRAASVIPAPNGTSCRLQA